MGRKVSAARARNNPIPGVGKNIAKVSFQGASMPELPVATKMQTMPMGGSGSGVKVMDNRIGGMQTLPGFDGTRNKAPKQNMKLAANGATTGNFVQDKVVTRSTNPWGTPKGPGFDNAMEGILSVKTKVFAPNKGPMTKNAPIGAKGMPSSFSHIQNVGAPRIYNKGGIMKSGVKLKGK